MSIIDTQGRPITSKRSTKVLLTIIDHKPTETPLKFSLGYEIDIADPAKIQAALQQLATSAFYKLREIGVVAAGGNVARTEPKTSE